jgi:hypothetical protein
MKFKKISIIALLSICCINEIESRVSGGSSRPAPSPVLPTPQQLFQQYQEQIQQALQQGDVDTAMNIVANSGLSDDLQTQLNNLIQQYQDAENPQQQQKATGKISTILQNNKKVLEAAGIAAAIGGAGYAVDKYGIGGKGKEFFSGKQGLKNKAIKSSKDADNKSIYPKIKFKLD